MTPLWLLDVDGVINAVTHEPPDGYVQADVPDGRGRTWPITYRKDVIDFIGQLHETNLVEVRWLTTWCESARDFLAPALGLPEFQVEGSDDHLNPAHYRTWWKSVTAQRLAAQEPERPLIWTDDDLAYSIRNRDVDWLDDWSGLRCLITTNTSTGLTDDELEQILGFLKLVDG